MYVHNVCVREVEFLSTLKLVIDCMIDVSILSPFSGKVVSFYWGKYMPNPYVVVM